MDILAAKSLSSKKRTQKLVGILEKTGKITYLLMRQRAIANQRKPNKNVIATTKAAAYSIRQRSAEHARKDRANQ